MSNDSSNIEASPQQSRKAWIAVASAVAIIVLFFAAQLIGSLLVSLVPAARHWSHAQSDAWLTNSIAAQFAFVAVSDGLVVVGIAWLLGAFHWQWQDIGLRWPKVWHIVVGMAAVVPYYVLYILLVLCIKTFVHGLNVDQKQEIGFSSVHGAVAFCMTFVSLVVIPPIVEEIAMRGFLYTGLRKWMPRLGAALAVSALFGAAHLMEGGAAGPLWIGAVDTFTLSLVLVSLREITGNLWAGISLHAAKNGIAFILLFVIAGR